MRQKAKKICPEIKDDYQIETFNFEIKGQNRKNEEITVENNINEKPLTFIESQISSNSKKTIRKKSQNSTRKIKNFRHIQNERN